MIISFLMVDKRIKPGDYNVPDVRKIEPISRIIEEEALLEHLLEEDVLNEKNLTAGIIIALGSSTTDQIALRRQTTAPIIPVDSIFAMNPTGAKKTDWLTQTKLVPEDASLFFNRRPYLIGNCSLVTAFHIQKNGFSEPANGYIPENRYEEEHSTLLEEIGRALKPTGQLLVTSETIQPWLRNGCSWATMVKDLETEYLPPPPNKFPSDAVEVSEGHFVWTKKYMVGSQFTLSKEEGFWRQVKVLPSPSLLIKQIGTNRFEDCLRDKTLEHGSSLTQITDFNDRFVWVMTKK